MKRFFVVTLFVVLPLLAAADFSIEKWQYERPVILPVKDEVGYVRLKLDRLIAGGSAGWKDIRVIKEGKEKQGLRYAPILIIGCLTVFYVSKYIIGNVFGNLF